MSVLKSALQSGIRLNAGRRNSRLSLYLVAASLVILVLLANIVHFERRGQHQPRPRTCDAKDIVLGISIPNANRKFQSLGGTKHWFHLVERLIINIDRMIELHKTVESMKGRSSKTIYIIFDRKYDVENLGPFGRLLFVSLVFGREIASDEALFERIIFGYSSLKTVIHHSGTMLVEAHQFHSHHIVDIKSRDFDHVFVKSADGGPTPISLKTVSICVQILTHLPLDKVDKKLEWFNSSISRFRLFHDWVCHTCDTVGRRSTSTAQGDSINKTEFSSTNETLTFMELLGISDDLNSGNGEMQAKIRRAAWNNKNKDSDLDPSPIIRAETSEKPEVLIYQRDASRRLVNLNSAMAGMSKLLGPRWAINSISHSDDLSPCAVINRVRTATVLITPHGFQSVLLLFQPLSSLLVEIHPAFYFKQEVYGFIQAGLRQNFKLARSYLAEESLPVHFATTSAVHIIRSLGFTTHDCLHNSICRNIARRQDVMMSETFMERTAEFIRKHFIIEPK